MARRRSPKTPPKPRPRETAPPPLEGPSTARSAGAVPPSVPPRRTTPPRSGPTPPPLPPSVAAPRKRTAPPPLPGRAPRRPTAPPPLPPIETDHAAPPPDAPRALGRGLRDLRDRVVLVAGALDALAATEPSLTPRGRRVLGELRAALLEAAGETPRETDHDGSPPSVLDISDVAELLESLRPPPADGEAAIPRTLPPPSLDISDLAELLDSIRPPPLDG